MLLQLKWLPWITGLVLAALVAPMPARSVDPEEVRFLPDEAQIACRAILPACFTKAGWAELCVAQDDVRQAHPRACRVAMDEELHNR